MNEIIYWDKKQAEQRMNFWGKSKEPFLFVIDFDMQNNFVEKLENISNEQIKFNFNQKLNYNLQYVDNDVVIDVVSIEFDEYKRSFDIVMKNILHGNSYLVNLTAQSEIKTNLTFREIFYLTEAKYKMLFDDKFLFFSPEIFVQIKDNKIYSYPMKGTIDASVSNAEEIILNDEKELAEHYTIVDLIRNDLNIVAKNVKVEKFRYIDHLKTSHKDILQVSSIISGVLPSNWYSEIGSILFAMLPAGSISGAPKKKTVEIIKQAENYKRGFYTGVAGIFDGKNLDSCVMIRFIEKINGKMFYKSGGGITAKSNLQQEYDELLTKIYLPLKK